MEFKDWKRIFVQVLMDRCRASGAELVSIDYRGPEVAVVASKDDKLHVIRLSIGGLNNYRDFDAALFASDEYHLFVPDPERWHPADWWQYIFSFALMNLCMLAGADLMSIRYVRDEISTPHADVLFTLAYRGKQYNFYMIVSCDGNTTAYHDELLAEFASQLSLF